MPSLFFINLIFALLLIINLRRNKMPNNKKIGFMEIFTLCSVFLLGALTIPDLQLFYRFIFAFASIISVIAICIIYNYHLNSKPAKISVKTPIVSPNKEGIPWSTVFLGFLNSLVWFATGITWWIPVYYRGTLLITYWNVIEIGFFSVGIVFIFDSLRRIYRGYQRK